MSELFSFASVQIVDGKMLSSLDHRRLEITEVTADRLPEGDETSFQSNFQAER